MSFQLVDLALQAQLPAHEKLVFLVIAKHADGQGRNAYPAVGTICRMIPCCRSTVQRALRYLRAIPLIEIQYPAETRIGGVYRRSTTYRINLEALSRLIPPGGADRDGMDAGMPAKRNTAGGGIVRDSEESRRHGSQKTKVDTTHGDPPSVSSELAEGASLDAPTKTDGRHARRGECVTGDAEGASGETPNSDLEPIHEPFEATDRKKVGKRERAKKIPAHEASVGSDHLGRREPDPQLSDTNVKSQARPAGHPGDASHHGSLWHHPDWQALLSAACNRFGRSVCKAWLSNLEPIVLDPDHAVLRAASGFDAAMIDGRYGHWLRAELKRQVTFTVKERS